MKRISRLAALMLALILLLSSVEAAHADSAYAWAYVKVTKSRVYTDASMGTRAAYAYKYQIVQVLEQGSEKAKVRSGNSTGYMYLKDISIITPLNMTAQTNRSAYVYEKPSTSSDKKAISKGTEVNVLAVNGSWVMIEKNGTAAYIQKACLTNAVKSETPAPSQTASEQEQKQYVLSGSVTESEFEAYVNCASLNIYAKASASSKKLGNLKRGTVVKVLAYNSQWAFIELDGSFGYCKKTNLKQDTTVAGEPLYPCTPFTAKVKSSSVKVYSSPSTASVYLGSLKKGVSIEVQAYNEKWTYISLNGRYGYTLRSGLSASFAPAATPAPTPSIAPTPSPTPAPTPTPSPTYVSTDDIFTDTSTSNEEKVWLFFTRETVYNEAVACGIMGNLKQESNFSPTSGKGKNYQGICQWSTTRFALLESWCEKNGFDPYSLEGQLKFLKYDLAERYVLYHKALLEIENTAQGAYDAGYYFCYHYERPAALESSSDKRGIRARDVYWVKYAH